MSQLLILLCQTTSLFHQAEELQHQREESNQQGRLVQVRSDNLENDDDEQSKKNPGQRVGRASAAPTYQVSTPPPFQTQGQTLAMAQETKSKCSLFLLGKGA